MVFISILMIIVSVLLIGIVLIQNSKGGGLMNSRYEMGVQRTTNFVEKATWALAGTLIVLCFVLTALNGPATTGSSLEGATTPVENTANN